MGEETAPHFWWVSQGSSYKESRSKGLLWAPKENENGLQFFYWTNVSRVAAGDFIFHYSDKAIRAISKAKSDGHQSNKPISGPSWSDDGWRVDADYCELSRPLPILEIGPSLAALRIPKGPVNSSGGANQGYLYELPEAAVSMILAKIGDDGALQASGVLEVRMPVEDISKRIAEEPPVLLDMVASFIQDLEAADVRVHDGLALRLVASLVSKRFLILTGLAGSGKTKIAQAFARWTTPGPQPPSGGGPWNGGAENAHYAMIPVGADWTSNENIVGYPDGLQQECYVSKPALDLICHAREPENAETPHFLILDEMNLSHVERYFADMLSAIESGEPIPLYSGNDRMAEGKRVPRLLALPPNLFIMGTVNVDETTYMFSPKVLDRANVIEFRMESGELSTFLAAPKAPRLQQLDGRGASYGSRLVELASDAERVVPESVRADYEKEMLLFFRLLRQHSAEFGYRTGYEAARLVTFYQLLGGYPIESDTWFTTAFDTVIVQKFLPKLHGSRSRIEGLLWALAWACGAERVDRYGKSFSEQLEEAGKAEDESKYSPEVVWNSLKAKNAEQPSKAARYPLSFEKVMRMWRKLVRDQFVSFAEA